MYIRPVHAELDIPTLQAFVKAHPLGLFTTAIPHPKFDTIQTTHIPFIIDGPSSPDQGHGFLRGHMARANPQCKALIDTAKAAPDAATLSEDVLVLFNAPVHHYVPPRFYTETKPDTAKVVPTWDYAAVQVYGRLKIHYENNNTTSDFLQTQVEDLTALAEDRHQDPNGHKKWQVSDAPEKYVDLLKKGIIGLEIEIKRIEGRFKLSQEMGDGDWSGVVKGFKNLGTEDALKMAQMVEGRGKERAVASS